MTNNKGTGVKSYGLRPDGLAELTSELTIAIDAIARWCGSMPTVQLDRGDA